MLLLFDEGKQKIIAMKNCPVAKDTSIILTTMLSIKLMLGFPVEVVFHNTQVDHVSCFLLKEISLEPCAYIIRFAFYERADKDH